MAYFYLVSSFLSKISLNFSRIVNKFYLLHGPNSQHHRSTVFCGRARFKAKKGQNCKLAAI